MGFIYGLAAILIIFEGIIIQCEGADDANSPKRIQSAPINDIQEVQSFCPNDLIELIVSKTDFETIQKAVRSGIVPANNIVMSRILQDHIISIMPNDDEAIYNYYHQPGEMFLKFNNSKTLESFFNKFGDQVKKIEIEIHFPSGDDSHNKINKNIIKRTTNLEELRVITIDDKEFWEEILNGGNGITFPEVKKFQIMGYSNRNEFKLNLIFPKLESFKIFGTVADANCLANVKGLKELRLRTLSIGEDQLGNIFANNGNMTKISLAWPNKTETMHSIARHLTKLKTLEVHFPGDNFLLRMNNMAACELTSVTHFGISFSDMDEVFGSGNFSFNMPHLKKLTLEGEHSDGRIINFIEHFKELEIVELLLDECDVIECFEKLKHIKEFTIKIFENLIGYLINMFSHSDKKSKLQTLKFVYFNESLYQNYEESMNEFNNRLKDSMKPTWTLSREEQIGTSQNYLTFRREPCTCESCKK